MDTINIITNSQNGTAGPGPYKVYANLTKGLDQIAQPYVVNAPVNRYSRTWIQDRADALATNISNLNRRVCGPNIAVHPQELPDNIVWRDAVYVQPSEWSREMWLTLGFHHCPIEVWPVGIDTDRYTSARKQTAAPRVVIYQKYRPKSGLNKIVNELERRRWPYSIVTYGDYRDIDYLSRIHWATFVIWHGCVESQGIALLEALSCDVPVLVCDCQIIDHSHFKQRIVTHQWTHTPSAAPYFDERCGTKILALDSLPFAIDQLLDGYGSYAPREFIVENLSLKKQAQDLVRLLAPGT